MPQTLSIPQSHAISGALNTWAAMPAALTELGGLTHSRMKLDLGSAWQCRLVTRVAIAGLSGATIRAQYSTDESAWSTLTTNTVSLTNSGTIASAWEDIPAAAKGDVFVRVVGQDGNGIAAVTIGNVILQVR